MAKTEAEEIVDKLEEFITYVIRDKNEGDCGTYLVKQEIKEELTKLLNNVLDKTK
jgi:hypothetical protein